MCELKINMRKIGLYFNNNSPLPKNYLFLSNLINQIELLLLVVSVMRRGVNVPLLPGRHRDSRSWFVSKRAAAPGTTQRQWVPIWGSL